MLVLPARFQLRKGDDCTILRYRDRRGGARCRHAAALENAAARKGERVRILRERERMGRPVVRVDHNGARSHELARVEALGVLTSVRAAARLQADYAGG